MSTRIHIGDVFEVPLSDGRKALGQYIFRDKMGPIIRIFGQILERDEEVRLSSLDSTSLLFPPVITGLLAAVRSGLWRVIGRLPIDGFQYPNFISAIYNERTGNYGMWYLWDGLISRPIGYELPEDYQSLERLIVWHPLNLVKRIESGDNPYAYPRHGN